MENNNTLTRSQIRSAIEDPAASAQSRLSAANMLIDMFGFSDRNRRLAKSTAKRFSKYIAQSPRSQMQVRFQAEKLLARIERALEAEEVVDVPDQDEPDKDAENALIADEPTDTMPQLIGGSELLPPDGSDDRHWDAPYLGSSRRRLFCLSWGIDESLSRAEIISAITADPARLESMTLRQQLWAMTRDQADRKFNRDSETIRDELARRQLEDSAVGRDELVRQILASGEPLLQFEKPSAAIDFGGTGLPVLIRSKTGQLIDAIDFISKWPHMGHNPL